MARWISGGRGSAATRATFAALGAVASLVGCPSPSPGPGDASDVTRMPDVTDAGDAPAPQTECNGVPVEDFDALATREGDTYRYRGDNRSVPELRGRGIQPSADAERCRTGGIYPRVFRHRMRTDGVLRVTVDAPGTARDFDTIVLASTGACGEPSRDCNDDTFYSDGSVTLRSSLTLVRESGSTLQPRLGTDVYISVAGFPGSSLGQAQGSFELVVTEVPPTADGEVCDEALQCSSGNCDVAPGTDGLRRCRSFSLTRDDGVCFDTCDTCGAGLTCAVSEACCRVIDRRAGDPCGAFVRCGAGLSCAYRPDLDADDALSELGSSRCTPIGARWGACRDDGGCDPGLSCGVLPGTAQTACRPLRPSGGACHALYDACPSGESCVAAGFDACEVDTVMVGAPCRPHESVRFDGTCRPLGSAGAPCAAGACAQAGLVCSASDASGACAAPLALGSPCVPPALCDGGGCAYSWVTGAATCVARGAPGGPCVDGAGCDAGGRCVNGRCVVDAPSGGECSLGRACPRGEACVPDEDGRAGRCVARGQAGGFCRVGGPGCDEGLVCSREGASYGLCQRRVATTCRPNRGTDRCPDGLVCGATSFTTGACVAPVTEREFDDRATEAQAVALPAAVAGRLQRSNPDCYSFELPRGGSVYAQATRPFGHVFASHRWMLSLWSLGADGGARELGRARGGLEPAGVLPRLDGLAADPVRNPFATGLAPGRYAVCLVYEQQASTLPVDNDYVLSIAAQSP